MLNKINRDNGGTTFPQKTTGQVVPVLKSLRNFLSRLGGENARKINRDNPHLSRVVPPLSRLILKGFFLSHRCLLLAPADLCERPGQMGPAFRPPRLPGRAARRVLENVFLKGSRHE